MPAGTQNAPLIKGQLVSIDEGNRTERVIIGLGAGRSDVRAHVQACEVTPTGSRLLDRIEIDGKSGLTPGMAESMGAGGLAGRGSGCSDRSEPALGAPDPGRRGAGWTFAIDLEIHRVAIACGAAALIPLAVVRFWPKPPGLRRAATLSMASHVPRGGTPAWFAREPRP